MTPNQVTAVSAVFTYSAIALLALTAPTAILALVVASLLLFGYALDSADGQLARLTKTGRPSGEWLDHVIDMGKICLLFSAVALSWTRFGLPNRDAENWVILVPLLHLAVSVVAFFGWLLSDLLIRVSRARAGNSAHPAPSGRASAARSLLRLPSDYGLLALTFSWFASWLFFVTILLSLAANAAILLAALPAWFRQVRAAEVRA
jgi:phosphatidylglycerophosphate synthase